MTTNKLKIVEIDLEDCYKIHGGTTGYTGGCIPEPFKIGTIYNPAPSDEILIAL